MSTTATIAPTGTWTADAKHSKVGFAVKHLGIATVRGEFKAFEGTFEIGEDLSTSRAYGKVNAASIDTNEPGRDEHLRSADFFRRGDQHRHPLLNEFRFDDLCIGRERADSQHVLLNGDAAQFL